MDTSSPPHAPAPEDGMFTAYLRPRRKGSLWMLGLTGLIALGLSLLADGEPLTFRVLTPAGVRVLGAEMSPVEVSTVLGNPLAPAGREGCVHYGYPRLDTRFLLHSVCYQDQRVRAVTSRLVEAREVESAARPRLPEPEAVADPLEVGAAAPGPTADRLTD